jgi:hypothetical protein
MSTSSDLEKTITASGLHNDVEKIEADVSSQTESKEKATGSTAASMAYPTSLAETNNHNTSVVATESLQRLGFTEAPPPLPFSCWDHKLSICIFWFFILAEVCFIPESFYYGLTFGTTLNHGACKSSLLHSALHFPDMSIPQYSQS